MLDHHRIMFFYIHLISTWILVTYVMGWSTLSHFKKIHLSDVKEEVQCLDMFQNRHFLYYDRISKQMKYRYVYDIEKTQCVSSLFHRIRKDSLCATSVFRHPSMDLVVFAMASYDRDKMDYRTHVEVMDTNTFHIVHRFHHVSIHPTLIRSCTLHVNDSTSSIVTLTSWSIDGIKSMASFSLDSEQPQVSVTYTKLPYPCIHIVHHVDNSYAIMDMDHTFHLQTSQHRFRHVRLPFQNASVTCFDWFGNTFIMGLTDHSLLIVKNIDTTNMTTYKTIHMTCRINMIRIYFKRFMIFLEDGTVHVGDMDQETIIGTLPIRFDPNGFCNAIVREKYFTMDGMKDGLTICQWLPPPLTLETPWLRLLSELRS